jgi:predicted DCC family thiol-disulfide oxidoreductase YuxK
MSSAEVSSAIVVFDGTCVLCSGWTSFLIRHDKRQRLRFTTTQSSAGRELLRRHAIDADAPQTLLLVFDDRAHVASDAVLHLLDLLGGPWRLARCARAIPRALRDRLYFLVARNRYRWFGRRRQCFVPDASQRQMFLLEVGADGEGLELGEDFVER